MATDPNITRIKFLRSKTANAKPLAADIDEGELAFNLADRTIFSKSGTSVVELGFGKGGTVAGAINQTVGGITSTGTITAPTFSGALSGNATTATRLQTARTISLSGSATGSISFDGTSNQSISVNVNAVDSLATYARSNADSPTKWAQGIQSVFVSSTQGWPMAYGGVITARPHSNGGGTLQILTAYGTGSTVGGGEIKIRTGDYSGAENDAWTSWKTLVHSENVSDYSPTKTGVGASGTWGIDVTGNAATATALQTARTIGGVSFNGSANINLPGVNTTGNQSTTGSAASLTTARSFSWTGDATGSLSFNGSANVSAALTLTNSGVSAGTYKSVTVDTKGRVTAGTNVVTGLVTSTAATGTTNAATSNTNTYLNIVETIGSSATTVGTSTQVTGAGTVTVTSDTAGKLTITGSQNITGNAATATSLQTARTLSWTGDATGSLSFNGSANVSAALTLANSGVDAGTYKSVTVDAKGRVTGGNDVVTSLVTSTSATGTSNVATTNTNTFLNIVEYVGATAVSSAGSSSQITGAGTVTVTSDTTGKITITGSQAITGNAATATRLQTARTIAISGAVTGTATSFDGSANIAIATTAIDGSKISTGTIPAARIPTLNQSTTGNAGSATKLQTARLINGVAFNGTANIQIDAIRVGTISWHLGERSSIFAGDLSLDGQILNRADYAELWGMVSSGRFKSVTDTVWLASSANRGCYSTGNGTTTFRLPDLNGMQAGSIQSLFLRGSSTTPVGTVLSDAIRNITGSVDAIRMGINWTPKSTGALKGTPSTNSGDANNGASATMVLDIDASRVVPTADENRPKSVYGLWVVSAKGSNVVVPAPSNSATLTGGNTFQGSQTINGDLVVKQNVKVEGLTADRFGLHDKMHWVGAYVQPYGTSVLNASVTTNTFQVIIRGQSGAKYWTKGRTKLHFIINHGAPQNVRFVTATVTDWSTTDSNKQTITATLSLVNHAMPLNTVFHWVGSTYESFGCDWAGWMNTEGQSRWVMRLKPTTPLKSLTPIITSSCSSEVYWNASQLSQPGVDPQPRNETATIVINSVHNGDVVFAIGDNNNEGSVSNEYVSISVKDFV